MSRRRKCNSGERYRQRWRDSDAFNRLLDAEKAGTSTAEFVTKSAKRRQRKQQRLLAAAEKSTFLRDHTCIDYDKYIKSAAWRRRSKSFIAITKRCDECNETKNLTCHHLHYRTLGCEKRDDVQVLCWPCHKFRHPDKNKMF